MIAHYLTLDALAAELRPVLNGASIGEIYTQSKHELLFTMVGRDGGERSLLVSVAAGMNAVFSREGRMRAKRNSTDIFPAVFGSAVSWISVDRFSRVFVVETDRHRLCAHLFNNAAANVFLVGRDGVILSAFRDAAKHRGLTYAPAGGADVPDPADAASLREAIARSDGTIDRAVRGHCPWLGPLYLRELFFRAGVDGSAPARGAGEAEVAALSSSLAGLLRESREPRPALYAGPSAGGGTFSVVELRHAGVPPERTFPTVNEGVRDCYSSRRREEGLEEEKSDLVELLGRERRRTEKSLKEAISRAGDATAADRHRKTGALILANLHLIRKGETEARLPDPGGGEVVVKLDRALTPAANANACFDRARKAETARKENEARIGVLTARLDAIGEMLGELDAAGDLRAVRGIRERLRTGRGSPVRMPEGERLPYRVFPIGDRYEAWVGKSSADNDALTFGHAGPHDWWMHVRGSPGSHVVLKSRTGGAFEPPKEVLRAAARIAAYYSKMKKAGTVPVAYCERKYVKKPKNAPPGTVTLQREEVVFVEPGLP